MMILKQLILRAIALSCVISGVTYNISVLGQSNISNSSHSGPREIRFIVNKVDPPNNGTPKTEGGTGSRGANCTLADKKPPLTRLAGNSQLNLTTKSYPTFWVYVPYTSKDSPSGEFSLHDDENEVYRTKFQLPATPGIVGFVLPKQVASLQIGKTYRWYFDINCPVVNAKDVSIPPSVTGIIQRVAVSEKLAQTLKSADSPLDGVAAYAEEGVWYDTLTELALLRLSSPKNKDFQVAWLQLLTDSTIGLKEIVEAELVGILSD
ncbi:MAG: DUF928 domain-containing protein [Nostoc sp. ChiQUE01a]|nr:DUF928 domain-containing protein [Nostoc sp. ChiQUE01a]